MVRLRTGAKKGIIMDISKFFDIIDHSILKQMLCSRIKDKKVLGILFDNLNHLNIFFGRGACIRKNG